MAKVPSRRDDEGSCRITLKGRAPRNSCGAIGIEPSFCLNFSCVTSNSPDVDGSSISFGCLLFATSLEGVARGSACS